MEQAKLDLLVLAAIDGNKSALSKLFKHYHQNLLRFAFRLGGDEALAHDSVQEAWLKVMRSLRNLRDPRAFKSWLYRSVRWQVLDNLKKIKNTRSLEDVEEPVDENIDNQRQKQLTKVESLIMPLPKVEREILQLFYIEDLALSEISMILNIPTGTVKSRLYRARNQLKVLIENEEQQ